MLSENNYSEAELAPIDLEVEVTEPEVQEEETVEEELPVEEPSEEEQGEENVQEMAEGGLEEEPNEVELLKRKLKDLRKKADKDRRKYFQTINQNAQLQKEVEEARKSYQLASEVANFHFASEIEKRIAMSVQKLKEAREMGDIDMETQAFNELQQANIEKSKIEEQKYQQQMQQQLQQEQFQEPLPPPQEFNPYELNREMVSEFLEQNDYWMNPQSPRYEPVLVQGVDKFLTEWNNNLVESGYSEFIGSEPYNRILQQKVEEAQAKLNTQKRRQPQMRQVPHAAAPVRGTARTSVQRGPQLSKDAQSIIQGLRDHGFKADTNVFIKQLEKIKAKKAQWGG